MANCWPLQVSPTEKSVLISLADNANDSGFCWPSIATICDRTCLGKSTVIRAIASLESRGLLRANRDNGRHTTYTITVAKDGQPVSERDRCQSGTGVTVTPNRCQSGTQPVSERDTNRKEPSRTMDSASKGTRLKIETLPKEWEDWCKANRNDLLPEEVFEGFRDWWTAKAGKDAAKVDWFATWRTWCRRQHKAHSTHKPDSAWAGAK